MQKNLTRKIIDGIGVKYLMLIIDKKEGRWPDLAPTKYNLEDAKIPPFNPPKVEHATDKGMIQEKIPNNRLPNVTATALEVRMSVLVRTEK